MPRKKTPDMVRHRRPTGEVVQIAAYVDPNFRMAVRIAAKAEGVSQSLFIQQAVEEALLNRYEPVQVKSNAPRALVNA